MNMVGEFNIPITDADFRSLLKEIEDGELREIVIELNLMDKIDS